LLNKDSLLASEVIGQLHRVAELTSHYELLRTISKK